MAAPALDEALRLFSREIAIAENADKLAVWCECVRKALTWRGFERAEIAEVLHQIADAQGLVEHFGEDAIQEHFAAEVEAIENAPKTNGGAQGNAGPESQDARGTYGPWHYHDAQPSPPTRWLIKKLLPETGSGLISGQWGVYKSTTALDLCVSVMGGVPFAGRFAIRRRGGVVYFAPEGAGGIKSRLDAIAKERGVFGALPFAWRPNCPPLMAPYALEHLARLFDEASKDLKENYRVDTVLALVDTIVAAAGYTKSGDDNDAAAAQTIMSRLSELSKKTGALALGVDHFGKLVETGTRGSSAKEGHADVVLALLGDREVSGTVTNTRLAIRKLRDGPSGLEIPFTPRDVAIGLDEDGEPETRVVVDWGDPGDAAAPSDEWLPSLQLLRRILMTMIVDAGKEVAPFADGPVVRAVDSKLVRAEFCKQYPADGDAKQKAATRRQAFGRAVKLAQSKSLIMVREVDDTQLMWLATREGLPA
jgi:hypothetical protein